MISHTAALKFAHAQKTLLRKTYDAAWQQGVASYNPDPNPEQEPHTARDVALAGLTGAALLAARRAYAYVAPASPDPLRRAVALAPAFTGLNRMTAEIVTLPLPAAVPGAAQIGFAEAAQQALKNWVESNAFRLDNGDSVSWAGEQAGFGEAADADGQLLEWQDEGDDHVCFPAGTLVLTHSGQRTIETLRVGDKVITHTGRSRCVTALQQRSYRGALVTVSAGDRSVRCTGNHPFLLERQNQLRWVCADAIASGERVVTQQRENLSNVDLGDMEYSEAAGAQVCVAPGLPLGIVVPVGPIDFDHEIFAYEEVDRVTADLDFLAECDPRAFERLAHLTLRRSLPAELTPAGAVTKDIPGSPRGTHAEALTAMGTCNVGGRAVALFGAELRWPAQRSTTTLARVFGQSRLRPWTAGPGAVDPTALVQLSLGWAKLPTTSRAYPYRVGMLIAALAGAVGLTLGIPSAHGLQAVRATRHPRSIPRHKVYSLTVEGDQSYVANGFVVHNCDSCQTLAEMPPQPLADWPCQPGDGATDCNVGCRCSLEVSDVQVSPGDVYAPNLTDAQQSTVSGLMDAQQAALGAVMPDAQYLQ